MRRGLANTIASLSAVGLLLPAAACGDEETVLGQAPPTEIAVDPVEFLGALPCSSDPGAAKAYVAILTDATPGFDFTLAAGPPAACSSRMAFRFINAGNVYTAEVDVYDVAADQLFPAGGSGSGSRVMHDAAGNVVAPRWRTQCGVGPGGGAVAVADTSVVVAGCNPLEAEGTSVTAIVVDPLGALSVSDPEDPRFCTVDGDPIAAIDIVPTTPESDPPLPPVTVACGAEPVVFEEGIVAGQAYAFRLEAREEEAGEVRWAATCSTVAAAGIQRSAECSAFTSSGAIVIPVADPDETPDNICDLDYDAFDVALTGPIDVAVPRTSCATETRVAPLPSGHYEGTLRTYQGGAAQRTASCEVDVIPDATSILACSFD